MSQPTQGHIAVVGSGTWGTTLAVVAARTGQNVTLYVRDPEEANRIAGTRRNERFLPDLQLPMEIKVTSDLGRTCGGATIILVVVPSQQMRITARLLRELAADAVVVSAAKGLERTTLLRMTEVIAEELEPAAAARVCALSGPNLAREIAQGLPATSVIAGRDLGAAEFARDLLMGSLFRVYTNEDVVGVEFAGALKNVIAIGAGIGDGLEAGDNAKAAFLTRGIAEIARLGVACGAQPLTFAGLAGIGDLIATCASTLSRNHFVGAELAKGRQLAEILAGMDQVAEGVFTTEAAVSLGQRLGIELPIIEQMHAVLFEGRSPVEAVGTLMRREARNEHDELRPGRNR